MDLLRKTGRHHIFSGQLNDLQSSQYKRFMKKVILSVKKKDEKVVFSNETSYVCTFQIDQFKAINNQHIIDDNQLNINEYKICI